MSYAGRGLRKERTRDRTQMKPKGGDMSREIRFSFWDKGQKRWRYTDVRDEYLHWLTTEALSTLRTIQALTKK